MDEITQQVLSTEYLVTITRHERVALARQDKEPLCETLTTDVYSQTFKGDVDVSRVIATLNTKPRQRARTRKGTKD